MTVPSQYVVRQTRHYYGPSNERSLVIGDDCRAMRFDTAKAARDHITSLDDAPYYMSHNESGRPDYSVCRVDRLPAFLAAAV